MRKIHNLFNSIIGIRSLRGKVEKMGNRERVCACLTGRKISLLVYQWFLTLVHIRNFEGVFIQYWGLSLIPRYSDFSGLELSPNISTF